MTLFACSEFVKVANGVLQVDHVEVSTRTSLNTHGAELQHLTDAMQTVFSGVTTLELKIWNTFNRVDQDLVELDGRVNC